MVNPTGKFDISFAGRSGNLMCGFFMARALKQVAEAFRVKRSSTLLRCFSTVAPQRRQRGAFVMGLMLERAVVAGGRAIFVTKARGAIVPKCFLYHTV